MKINEINKKFRDLDNSLNLLRRFYDAGLSIHDINEAFKSQYIIIWEGRDDLCGIVGSNDKETIIEIYNDAESDGCACDIYNTSDMTKMEIKKIVSF